MSIWGSELELFQFQQTALLYLPYTLRELWGGRMLVQGFLTLPGLAYHEHILARGALKDVIGHTPFMLLTLGRKQHGGLQGFVVLARLGLEETIQSYHIVSEKWEGIPPVSLRLEIVRESNLVGRILHVLCQLHGIGILDRKFCRITDAHIIGITYLIVF